MKRDRSAIVLGLFAVLVVVAGIAFWNYRSSVLNQKPASSTQPATTALAFQDQKITDHTAPFTIDVTYPSVTGDDGFNAAALKAVNDQIAQFKSDSLANGKMFQQEDPTDFAKNPPQYALTIGYDKGALTDSTASAMLNVYQFEGGADGVNFSVPVNYDIKNNKAIMLADLFPGKKNYLQQVSAYCVSDLKKQIAAALQEKTLGSDDLASIQSGAAPVASNYTSFLINPDNTITVYFAQDQVAFHAAGSFKVIVPISAVK
jgi:hypothetical protein